jgi:hypothetical protein
MCSAFMLLFKNLRQTEQLGTKFFQERMILLIRRVTTNT